MSLLFDLQISRPERWIAAVLDSWKESHCWIQMRQVPKVSADTVLALLHPGSPSSWESASACQELPGKSECEQQHSQNSLPVF